MSAAFPVFIGVTGKRHFSDDPAIAQTLERTVSERLAGVFDYIDMLLPATPKVLLTGAALGTDLIAAEEVLGLDNGGAPKKPRPNWLVLAVLPFAEEMFKEDFKDEEWERYRRVVSDSRTRLFVLPPLRTADGAAQAAELDRRPDATSSQRELRRRHYEQVGLWIVDTANVMLAVLSGKEAAGSIGGTARILACRRSGQPDPVALEVVRASTALAPRSDLQRAPNGFAWLLDPAAEPLCAFPPVTVLPPAPDLTPWKDVYAAPSAQDWGGPGGAKQPETSARQSAHLQESCRVLKIAGDFVRDSDWPASNQSAAAPVWPTAEGRTAILHRIAESLTDATNRLAREYRTTTYWLAGYFVLAVLAFETYEKFALAAVLALYLIIIFLAVFAYRRAGKRGLQPMAEDRRSIREALRVQEAWWQAGLDDRVDFFHLAGADQDLARVRGAIRNVIAYALITGDPGKEQPDWKSVFVPPGATASRPKDWIGSQRDYFFQRRGQRHKRGVFMEAVSWTLFVTATCLAFLLLLHHWDVVAEYMSGFVNSLEERPYWETMLITFAAMAATAYCWWLGGRLLVGPRTSWGSFPLAIAINLPAAFFLFLAAHLLATVVIQTNEPPWIYCAFIALVFAYLVYFMWKVIPDANNTYPARTILGITVCTFLGLTVLAVAALLDRRFDTMNPVVHLDVVADYMTIVLVVFVPALGGAVRFVAEKLAVEAEALSYRDAHLWFERATERLQALAPGHGDEHADAQARATSSGGSAFWQ